MKYGKMLEEALESGYLVSIGADEVVLIDQVTDDREVVCSRVDGKWKSAIRGGFKLSFSNRMANRLNNLEKPKTEESKKDEKKPKDSGESGPTST